jgi:hypothetical protein
MHSIAEQQRVADAIRRATLCVKVARVEIALKELRELLTKANFNPNQPRVPAGNPDGGQWTDDPSWTGGWGSDRSRRVRVAQVGGPGRNDPRILSDATPQDEWKPGAQYAQNRPPRGQFPTATPGQQARLLAIEAQAAATVRRVQEIDPNWRPREADLTVPGSVQGYIARAEARAAAAEARLLELGRLPQFQLIEHYAATNATRNLFGQQTWPLPRSAISVTTLNGQPVFGVHSRAPTHLYTSADAEVARREARALAQSGWLPAPANPGAAPYNSLFHAESTVLLRAAGLNGGTLAGQRLEVSVNRLICPNCFQTLPHLVRRLGNPLVTFIDKLLVRHQMGGGAW